jgi:peptidoglycan/LPS O-acetylase OafA/YrhL
MQLPRDASELASNIAIFGLHMGDPVRLVPPAWALHIELCHYVAIGLVLGRSPLVGLAWLAASGLWFVNGSARLLDDLYFTVAGASLPFAVGCCVFHGMSRLPSPSSAASARVLAAAAVAVYVAPYAWVQFFGGNALRWPFFVNIATTAVLLAALVRMRGVSAAGRRIDAFLGDLSYPVYLFHFPVGAFALYATGIVKGTPAAFVVVAVATLAVAAVEARLLSRPVERWRARVKAGVTAGRK